MDVIRGLWSLHPDHRGCAATIGNFDGVHLGHQAMLRRLREHGAALGLPATAIIFEPQPQEFFAPERAPARLTRLREKLSALRMAGLDRVVLLHFGRHIAELSAGGFVEQLLVDKLGVRYLIVGDDFRFGRGREGDLSFLRAAGERYGFQVAHMDTYAVASDRVSSTRIRNALAGGDLETAAHCLGRPYRICGRVARGDRRGRSIGFPTANIDLHRRVSPLHGVFAVRVYGLGGAPRGGVANLGTRPTVTGDTRYLLEVHIFDFQEEIYGRHLEIEFVQMLRAERRFDSFQALKEQIRQDARQAVSLLGACEPGTVRSNPTI